MVFPDDVLSKIEAEFEEKNRVKVMELLSNHLVEPHERIVRCTLFETNGDLEQFKINIDLANHDYRNIIVQAEYDDEMNRLRNFNRPFGNEAIIDQDFIIDDADREGDDLPF